MFFLLFTWLQLTAQSGSVLLGTPYTTFTTYSDTVADAFSGEANAAAWVRLRKTSVGLYSERRFLIQELSVHRLAAVMPAGGGAFGLSATYSGSAALRQTVLAGGYARTLGNRAQLGLRFHYVSFSTEGYGSASALLFDAGFQLKPTDHVLVGISVFNPVGTKLGKSGAEPLPSVYTAGIGYDASPQFHFDAQVRKSEGEPVDLWAGFQYRFGQKLLARAGVQSATAAYTFGFGVVLKGITIHLASSFHPSLGPTPGLLLLYGGRE